MATKASRSRKTPNEHLDSWTGTKRVIGKTKQRSKTLGSDLTKKRKIRGGAAGAKTKARRASR